MKLFLSLTLAALTMTLPVRAAAETTAPVVVELFTSQGCSSCPPADRVIETLAARSDVIPLALHVDYWDYIGWKDTFAQPKFTTRQKGYAHTGGRRMIYTPQMVVNGQEDVVGAKTMELADLIARHKSVPRPVGISAQRDGDRLMVDLDPRAGEAEGPLDVFLVRFSPNSDVSILRGENAGRTITYTNTVRDWSRLGDWNGAESVAMDVEISGDLPAVIIVQQPGYGAILAAARVQAP